MFMLGVGRGWWGRCDIEMGETDTWTPPLGLPMYNVYDSPRGFQQKLQLLKVICIHIPEDDGGNEVLEG